MTVVGLTFALIYIATLEPITNKAKRALTAETANSVQALTIYAAIMCT